MDKILTIERAEYIRDYILLLHFNNGESLYCDFLPLSQSGICTKLRDVEYFKNYTIDPFTIDWNNEIGFASKYLYKLGTPQSAKPD